MRTNYGQDRELAFRSFIGQIKNNPCTDCGQHFPPECMDFDHVIGIKLQNIAWLNNSAVSTIFEELEKCELVCANCHRIRTKARKKAKKDGTTVVIGNGGADQISSELSRLERGIRAYASGCEGSMHQTIG